MHINECVEIIRVSVVQSLECKVTNPKVQNSKQKCSTKKKLPEAATQGKP